jgi:putative drug exporter of the RND superfamily
MIVLVKFIGRLTTKYRISTLITSLIVFLALGAIGSAVIPKMTSGGYTADGSSSVKVSNYLTNVFHQTDPAVILAVDTIKPVNDPSVVREAENLESAIAQEKGVVKTLSFWSANYSPLLASPDHHTAYLFVYGKFADPTLNKDLAELILNKYNGNHFGFKIYVGGLGSFSYEISNQISKDLRLAESISVPVTFLLLLIVFGSAVASLTPLLIGFLAILGSLFTLYLISYGATLSIFALNLVTGMGLGLGIDYSLLIVNRFREELNKGKDKIAATLTTINTAGKTVFFSGTTVIISLAALTFFHLSFLRSFGYAGISVIAMAVFGSLVPLPALLALLGKRVDKGAIRKGIKNSTSEGGWAKIARFVMKRPILVVSLTLSFLALLTFPVLNVHFSQVDTRTLPANDRVAFATQLMNQRFPSEAGNPVEIIIPNFANPQDPNLAQYVKQISQVPGVVEIGAPEVTQNTMRISVVESIAPRSAQGENLIIKLRSIKTLWPTLIGGAAASYTDSQQSIGATLPWALGWIALGTLILLFFFTGSVILPIKAVILNFISLGAMLGAITFVFVSNHLKFLVGNFTSVGSIDTSILVLIIVVAFGLSMDYEVFLLSRIREEHESGLDNQSAVVAGVQRSARIITAAALLLTVVFAAFLTSKVTMIKILGFGVAVAILVDATIIRALLVPALMRLFGEANWWAPKSWKRFTIKH